MTINWWNWRPIVALLVRAGILPAGEREECCLGNGCGGGLSASEALRAAEHIEGRVDAMKPDQRILFDGGVTEKPIDYGKSISELNDADVWNSYSARYEVLKQFAVFCRAPAGSRFSERRCGRTIRCSRPGPR